MRYFIVSLMLVLGQGCTSFDRYDAAFLALHAIDTGQTVTIARTQTNGPCPLREGDLFTSAAIGNHPTESDVYKWSVAQVGLHFATKWALKKLDVDTKNLEIFGLGLRAHVVYHNHTDGVRAFANNAYACQKR